MTSSFVPSPRSLGGKPRVPVDVRDVAVILHPADQVAIVKRALPVGTVLQSDEYSVELRQMIPSGHKVALQRVAAGEPTPVVEDVDAPVEKSGLISKLFGR